MSEDETAWAVHQSEEQNKGKLWSHGGLATELRLPRLVYLPSIVAKYATEQPHTAWEVHQYLNETVSAEESVVEETEVEKLKVWLLAVGQTAGAKALALSMAPVVTTAAVFEEWCFNHINSYLGEKVSNQANQMNQPVQQGSNVMEEVVRMILRNFEESAKKTEGTAISGEKNDDEKVKPYTQYEIAKLIGYCSETDPAQLPEFWKLVKTTKETDDHRMNLHRKMFEWSKSNGIDIDRSIFFAKEMIEDIVKMRFNSVGLSATLTTCEKGISNLLCLPRTSDEIEALKLFEQAIEETRATRTLKEAERIAASNKRDPTVEYHSLKLMVATYASLLYVLFGSKCHLYEQVLTIYKVLNQDEVFANRLAFDAVKCKQVTWAIFEDSRSSFLLLEKDQSNGPGCRNSNRRHQINAR